MEIECVKGRHRINNQMSEGGNRCYWIIKKSQVSKLRCFHDSTKVLDLAHLIAMKEQKLKIS